MKRGFKTTPISKSDLDEAQMVQDGTYYNEERCADFFYDEECLANESVNHDVPEVYEYDNEYFDKRLKNDFHKEYKYVVCGILGDTETHYVQPVRTVGVFLTKHEAMECVRASILKLRIKFPNLYQSEIRLFEDYTEIRLQGNGEVIFTVHKVLPNGYIDIDRL